MPSFEEWISAATPKFTQYPLDLLTPLVRSGIVGSPMGQLATSRASPLVGSRGQPQTWGQVGTNLGRVLGIDSIPQQGSR
jgi:hypothetical protein